MTQKASMSGHITFVKTRPPSVVDWEFEVYKIHDSFWIWGGRPIIGAPTAEAKHGGEICRRRAANFADFSMHRNAPPEKKAYIYIYIYIYIYMKPERRPQTMFFYY